MRKRRTWPVGGRLRGEPESVIRAIYPASLKEAGDVKRGLVGEPKTDDSVSVLTPLRALKAMVLGSYERERQTTATRADINGRRQSDSGMFEGLSSQVRAAQRSGEISPVDAGLLTALILSAVVGAADLSRQIQSRGEGRANETDCPALTLIDLLSTRRCN